LVPPSKNTSPEGKADRVAHLNYAKYLKKNLLLGISWRGQQAEIKAWVWRTNPLREEKKTNPTKQSDEVGRTLSNL